VVATKGGVRRPDGRWLADGRASHLRAACEASRRALDIDVIDLYQLHTVDPRTPLETSVRALAAPSPDEGFAIVEERAFARQPRAGSDARAVIVEFDRVLCYSAQGAAVVLEPDDVRITPGMREALARYQADGWKLLATAWRPQIAQGLTTEAAVRASFVRTRALLGLDIEFSFCPHAAGPPVCWCRKPLPGLVLEFAHRHNVALAGSLIVGNSQADQTLSRRLGMTLVDPAAFSPAGVTQPPTRA
jgi:histidinol phosphatase-like enzyme